MSDLLPLHKHAIHDQVKETVNARELYVFLVVKARFNDWITRRIEQYGFVQGVDFIVTQKIVTDKSMAYEGANPGFTIEEDGVSYETA